MAFPLMQMKPDWEKKHDHGSDDHVSDSKATKHVLMCPPPDPRHLPEWSAPGGYYPRPMQVPRRAPPGPHSQRGCGPRVADTAERHT